ncbi:MAG: murein L,D-transpeptidase catalytic domain family protein [Flavobacteriales bacterium]|nr:murein L,D-transpeptidase catalytic domain family protein [Flavobacteriales bacterium]MBP7155400.1 murein L,D-transpeptidase catalytic domain family protein [Flavobacteriales bacterium]HQV74899.1 murein L,D-transpeptidase catalytic domain family protein [Flavobacteriales bacterium]HQW40557.1 murein L,D-transpeptidase catalytic domain family protein [Flavobacteriales bacterium]
MPLLLALIFSWLLPEKPMGHPVLPPHAPVISVEETPTTADELYAEIGLKGILSGSAFQEGYERMVKFGITGNILAIADMTQPSTAKRLYVIDLEQKVLVMRTWVAHGQNTGELYATAFSNKDGSHQSSLGLYRVGARIISPKHGPALLLEGLEKGVNNNALSREVIMHAADYVSAGFIAQHGRLGRSWGCPAVSQDAMPRMIELLAAGGMLYVHGG